MLKYELIPGQLLHEGTITSDNIFSPTPCSEEIIYGRTIKFILTSYLIWSFQPLSSGKLVFRSLPR